VRVGTGSELGMTQHELLELFLPVMREYAATALEQRDATEQQTGDKVPHIAQLPQDTSESWTKERHCRNIKLATSIAGLAGGPETARSIGL